MQKTIAQPAHPAAPDDPADDRRMNYQFYPQPKGEESSDIFIDIFENEPSYLHIEITRPGDLVRAKWVANAVHYLSFQLGLPPTLTMKKALTYLADEYGVELPD